MIQQWIPILPSVLLEPKEVIQAFVQDIEVVIWRSEQGRVQIWENRCPHRSVRLSLGEVHGESLICAYHGWQFSADHGQCQRIPAQPTQRVPSTLCSTTYAVAEQDGMIWFGGHSHENQSLDMPQSSSYHHYAGSVHLQGDLTDIQQVLFAWGIQIAPWQWQLTQADLDAMLWLTPIQQDQAMLHMMKHSSHSLADAFHRLQQVRDQIENKQEISYV